MILSVRVTPGPTIEFEDGSGSRGYVATYKNRRHFHFFRLVLSLSQTSIQDQACFSPNFSLYSFLLLPPVHPSWLSPCPGLHWQAQSPQTRLVSMFFDFKYITYIRNAGPGLGLIIGGNREYMLMNVHATFMSHDS